MNQKYKLDEQVVLSYNRKNINNGLVVRVYKTEVSYALGSEIKIRYCVQTEGVNPVRFAVEENELQPIEPSVDLK